MITTSTRLHRLRMKRVEPKTAAEVEGRVIIVFGPPCSGVTTIIDTLIDSSKMKCNSYRTKGLIYHFAEVDVLRSDFNALFVDFDGGLIEPIDIQSAVDYGALAKGFGAVVRVDVSIQECLQRARTDCRDDYINEDDLKEWRRSVGAIERKIRQHNLDYFMIPNHDLSEAVRLLALRSGITK